MIEVTKKGFFMKRKWNLLILLCLSLVLSCGKKASEDEEVKGIENVNPYDWTTPMRAQELLTEEEFGVAENICHSFQNMRAFLATQSAGLDLDFRVETKSCGSSDLSEHNESAQIQYSRSAGVTMSTNSRTSMATDVLSDRHERLSHICSEVISGTRPSNTIVDGALRYQVNFFSTKGYEYIQIAEFKKNSSGIFYPYLIEKAAIVTETSSSREVTHGFTKYRAVHRPCSNNTNSYVLQEWL